MAPPRSRHTKSSSVASSSSPADVAANGIATTPSSKSDSASVARKRRPSRSTASSPAGSPVVVIPNPSPRTELQSNTPKAGISQRKEFEPLKLAVILVLSTALESGLQTAASMVGVGDLAGVSRSPDTWVEVLGLLGWKIAKLGVYWVGDFDAYDVASLSLLLDTPPALLLGLFYEISPVTLTSTTLSSVIANSLPYYLLRPLSPSHHPNSAPKSSLRNRPILTDPYTTVATSLLAAAIFAVLLEASFATFLPTWLIVYFTGLRTLEPAHLGPAGLPTLLLALVPAGWACMEFLFAPSTAAAGVSTGTVAHPSKVFDPSTATFWGHVYHNAWGWYSARQKELITRTGLLTGLMVAETVLTLWGTVAGVEITGALGYAGVWGLGCVVTGAVLDWVGGPSD
ncbi:uncharacterized protein Z520_02942 [Fonsecaea multimorphosa CBS 102226]|uniref:Uncharacterized protein n=1 Tax=Fonsecaea multimorphosa CBS 102226 TaxID=1442371 RepID=A0A0D2KDR2_9EURO|nr:uncharacterized protein Z520_02942 [Fonsecaea multimorphosa CBS 102226]KIY01390.1 hypothetical protein Z520_02942 [Fonsecaea multimorphosa CBS 102226]OAL28407.1 hypothetical protein AYO22_02861 [Fonsecaea multimorphosa]